MDIVVKSRLEADIIEAVTWRSKVTCHHLPAGTRMKRALRTVSLAWRLRKLRPEALIGAHLSSPAMAQLFSLLVGARRSVLPAGKTEEADRVSIRPGENKALYYGRYFAQAGLGIDLSTLSFPPVEAAEAVQPMRIVLAPAVGAVLEQHKRWNPENFAGLTGLIAEAWPAARIELYGAPPERPLLEAVRALVPDDRRKMLHIVTPASPSDAASHLVGAACLVSACSGAAHLGALAGVPIVGLFGPTNPGFTGPFSRRLYVVRRGLACSPCYRADFQSGCGTPVCMSRIGYPEAFAAVQDAIADRPPPPVPWLAATDAVAPSEPVHQ